MRPEQERHDDAGGATPDPWMVLGLAEGASPEAIDEAWRRKVREHPPDSDGEAFEQIRDAYELLRDPLERAVRTLEGPDPDAPLVELLGEPGARRCVGPEPWLAVLGEP